MFETMDEIMDEISDQEIALMDKNLRAGFVLMGTEQFDIMMRLYKRELMGSQKGPDMDGSVMFQGRWIVLDLKSKDRFDVMPESSIRTDSIMRNRGGKIE